MRTIAKMKLVRPTRRGHTIVTEKIALGNKTLTQGIEEVTNYSPTYK